MLLQQLKKAATLKNFQLVARAAAGSDAGFAVEGKVEIVNITQDGPAGNASLLRQLARACVAVAPADRQSLTGVRLALIHLTELAKRVDFLRG